MPITRTAYTLTLDTWHGQAWHVRLPGAAENSYPAGTVYGYTDGTFSAHAGEVLGKFNSRHAAALAVVRARKSVAK